MTVVRIKIQKIFTQKSYGYRESANVAFASEYLVQTDVSFPSDELDACARSIAEAESRLHPPSVRFELATVKLATPGLSAEQLQGQFRRVRLSSLQSNLRGQWEMGEDEALAFPPVVGTYVRNAQMGTGPTLTLPYVITGAEWNLYTHKRVLPARFQDLREPNPDANFAFGQDLYKALLPINGQYVLLIKVGEDEYQLRRVSQLFFRGFRVNSVKPKKKAAKKTVPRRASFGEEENETDAAPTPKKSKVPVAGVVYMLQGGQWFKIGKSVNPDKRLTQIKLQIPFPVEVVHTIRAANPSEVESYWHRRFAALRQNGEWFLLTNAEVSEFKNVSEM